MLVFKTLTAKDLKKLQKFTEKSPYFLCDYSIGVMYMWLDYYKYEYAVFNDTLILKTGKETGKELFFAPLGKDKNGAYAEIEKYCVENELPLYFTLIDGEETKRLADNYEQAEILYDRDFSDYIYSYDEIYNLTGKKFSGQRNHINAFKKAYPDYEYVKLTARHTSEILDLLKTYKKEHGAMRKVEKDEYEYTKNLVKNIHVGKFTGGAIRTGGRIAAFTIGEYVGNMLVIHVEKGLFEYRGIYPAIFHEFVMRSKKDGVLYINREDDAGDPGLRISKTQYQPVMLADKFDVLIKKPMNITHAPVLKGKKVYLSRITEKDKQNYFELYTDKSLNRYWGYDYKKDVADPSPDAFFNMQKNDFRKRDNLCLAIRTKRGGELIGEVIMYNFGYDNTVETGVRLFKKYQKKGYGSEAVSFVRDYIANELKKIPVAKCHIKNEGSKKLFLSLGYELTETDGKFYRFRYETP